MPIDQLPISYSELTYILNIALSLAYGIITGVERELKNKPAGIATHCFVIGGSMTFAFISQIAFPQEPTRIAAQIVTGVGFLGTGIIIKQDGGRVDNLTTAASVWFAAAIGMALGYGYHVMAFVATIYAVIAPQIPNVKPKK